MVRGAVGIDAKRAFILLAAAALTVFLGVTLVPGEPAAQTAPPNGKIAYVGFDAETQKQDVYSMNPDGTGVTNLTRRYTDPNWSPLGNAHGNPEWSPDGTKISFTGTALSDIGSCCSRNVYVMDADGANLRRLTTSPSTSEGEDFQATWAPDGSWLAFVSTRGDPYDDRDIYRMDADGTNQQQLTFSIPTSIPTSIPPPGSATNSRRSRPTAPRLPSPATPTTTIPKAVATTSTNSTSTSWTRQTGATCGVSPPTRLLPAPPSIWRAVARTRHGLLTEAASPTRAPRAATVRSGL